MDSVGIKELKARLSSYVRAAHGGRSILITDRGAAVARIVPIDATRATLDALVDAGIVLPPAHRDRPAAQPLDIGAVISDLVADQRR